MSHLKYHACLLAVLIIVPWILSSGIQYSLEPGEIDQNTLAYLYLVQANEFDDLSDIKECASFAYQIADDVEIRQLAEQLISAIELLQKANIKTISEANSFKGGVKSFLKGAISPSYGLESAILLIDMFISKPEKMEVRLDEKYGPIIEDYLQKEQTAQVSGKVSFWLLLIIGAVVYFGNRKKIDTFFHPNGSGVAEAKKDESP